MSTIPQNNKRITKQIRISVKIHKELKFKAIEKNMTMSKLADKMIKRSFKKNIEYAKRTPNVP